MGLLGQRENAFIILVDVILEYYLTCSSPPPTLPFILLKTFALSSISHSRFFADCISLVLFNMFLYHFYFLQTSSPVQSFISFRFSILARTCHRWCCFLLAPLVVSLPEISGFRCGQLHLATKFCHAEFKIFYVVELISHFFYGF